MNRMRTRRAHTPPRKTGDRRSMVDGRLAVLWSSYVNIKVERKATIHKVTEGSSRVLWE